MQILTDVLSGTFTIGDIVLAPGSTAGDIRKGRRFSVYINEDNKSFCLKLHDNAETDGLVLRYVFCNAETGRIEGFMLIPGDPVPEDRKMSAAGFLMDAFGAPHCATSKEWGYFYQWGSVIAPFSTVDIYIRPHVFVSFQ